MNRYKVPVYSLRLVKERTLSYAAANVLSPVAATSVLRDLIGDKPNEHLACVFLDAGGSVVGSHIIAIGGIDSLAINPRDVFRAAIVANAHRILIGHNHPSGDPLPSAEDKTFTARIVAAGKTLGISIVDHVIVTRTEAHYSFIDRGIMP